MSAQSLAQSLAQPVAQSAAQSAEMKRFNEALIGEFRARGGRPGGAFEGRRILLLTTIGRHTGRPHTTPLAYSGPYSGNQEAYVVTASNRGAETRPHWYLNLRADPAATIEVGTRTLRVRAFEVTDADERARLYAAHAAMLPSFGDYLAAAQRIVPVLTLRPVDPGDPHTAHPVV